ncbi:MAG TPA: hypothetical protein VGR35_07615 [Tepidisphaeraceae bacterium]|nr:hypothetical protein [Tepidisphaeraceae bacterium]
MWIEIQRASQAWLTPLIACLAVWIAFQQFRVARNKLRLDLYEKRFKVYSAVKEFILSGAAAGNR